nr:hypothetical protein [Streptomyces sp. 846.5]
MIATAACAKPTAENPATAQTPLVAVTPLSPSTSTSPSGGSTAPHSCPDGVQQQTQGGASPAAGSSTSDDATQAQALAQAVGNEEFNATYAGIFGTVIDGYLPGRTALCVTDVARGKLLAQAAKHATPAIDLSRLDIFPCRYSESTLQTAVRRLMAHSGPTIAGFPVYQIGPATNHSGIQLETSQAGTTSAALRQNLASQLGSIAFTITKGEQAAG